MSFHFDAETHTYTLGERTLPGVTTILKEAGMIDVTWFTDESRARGTAVHEAVFFDIHGDLDFDSLHPKIAPYLAAWDQFKRNTNFKPNLELCEVPQYHPVYLYAGKPDLIGTLNGRNVLIDIKTGESPTAQFQTAAYANFPQIAKYSPARFSLRLKPDGTYKLKNHSDYEDFPVFLQAFQKIKNKS